LLYIAEKQCRGYHELKEYANHIGISESYLKVILSRLAKRKLITRYWSRTEAQRRERRYCINPDKVIIIKKE